MQDQAVAQQTAPNGGSNGALGRVRFWWKNARPGSLPQSVTPAILAVLMAVWTPGFNVWLSVAAVVAVALAHLSMNLFDDYFDYRKKETGYRKELAGKGFRAYTAKCPYLQSGEATVPQLLRASLIFLAIALGLGLVILAARGWTVLIYFALLLVLGLSYSGDPLRLGYRGLGELVIGIIFGPLSVTGVYLAASGSFSVPVLMVGVAVGLLTINILYTHSMIDLDADLAAEKLTLAGLIRKPSGMMAAHVVFNFGGYVCIAIVVAAGMLSPLFLLSFIALPWSIELFRSLRAFFKDPHSKVVRKPWTGPMGNWDAICKMGLDWFLYRWLLARNTLALFCILCMVAAVIPLGL